jgi:hypothetical protein
MIRSPDVGILTIIIAVPFRRDPVVAPAPAAGSDTMARIFTVLLTALAAGLILTAVTPWPASAQGLPEGPVSAFGGRLAVGAEVSASVGGVDHSAYFNYTDYEHNTLRMFRLALSAAWRPVNRVELIGEVRTEDLNVIRPYAAYVRVRPWANVPLDLQAGLIPPSFGAYGRRGYQASDNALAGYPLAYQYLTALRPDAVPATLGDLVGMRARGWRLTYPIGSQEPGPGVPLVSAFRWDTGIQGHWQGNLLDVTASVTTGTLADPQGSDNNDGKQLSGRVALRPLAGLVIGGSAARGDFFDSAVIDALPAGSYGSPAQTAYGADAEYSRDRWLVRGELVWSHWELPIVARETSTDLDALGAWVEARYRVTPRIVVAARFDRLGFSRVEAGPAFSPTWDARVRRYEVDGSYYLQRNLAVRLAVQHNDREGGRVTERTYIAGQLAYWF